MKLKGRFFQEPDQEVPDYPRWTPYQRTGFSDWRLTCFEGTIYAHSGAAKNGSSRVSIGVSILVQGEGYRDEFHGFAWGWRHLGHGEQAELPEFLMENLL